MTMSVIVCAYNEERTLAACLHSLLAQTRTPDEIIVVNNASTDGTSDVARAVPGVAVVDEPRKGLVVARETGRRDADAATCWSTSTPTAARRSAGSSGSSGEFGVADPARRGDRAVPLLRLGLVGRALIRAYDWTLAPAAHLLVQHVLGDRRHALRRQLRGAARRARAHRRLRPVDRVPRRGHQPRRAGWCRSAASRSCSAAGCCRRRAATGRMGKLAVFRLYVRNFWSEIAAPSAARPAHLDVRI